jgi:hypothetical protein
MAQLSPVQLIAAAIVDGTVPAVPAPFSEKYGVLGPNAAHPAVGQFDVTLDAVSTSTKPGNIVKALAIGPAAKDVTFAYINNTPAGPTVIRFYLWDGAGAPIDGAFNFELTQLPSSDI